MMGAMTAQRLFAAAVFFSVVVSPIVESDRERNFVSSDEEPPLVTLVSTDGGGETAEEEGGSKDLVYDYYRNKCPEAEGIVRSRMARIYSQNRNVSAQLLRLFFHDCFIEGCDASVLLDDSNGDKNRSIEKQASPNQSLKGFDKIGQIKEALETVCPGVVSCADILSLATRDGIFLAGGPYYPVLTGRRDSTQSYYDQALAEIPRPDDNITETLHLFKLRGFSDRETVALLGAHNIGKIGCEFLQIRLFNFSGTGQPDPQLPPEFLDQMRLKCQDDTNMMTSSTNATSSIPSGEVFDTHYFKNLMRGRGILYSDQQLMADKRTARVVAAYASEDGSTFQMDFARAMTKMSKLSVLTGSQGQVRFDCSLPVHTY